MFYGFVSDRDGFVSVPCSQVSVQRQHNGKVNVFSLADDCTWVDVHCITVIENGQDALCWLGLSRSNNGGPPMEIPE